MTDRLVYLGWALLGALSASAVSLGLGWLVGAFWVGFAITFVLGVTLYLFGDRVVGHIDRAGYLPRVRDLVGRYRQPKGRHHKS